DASTPAVYQSAWLRARWRPSPLCATPSTFSDRIGSTHGIRFSTRPPSRARTSAPIAPPAGRPAPDGGRVRAALSPEASRDAMAPSPAPPASARADAVAPPAASPAGGTPPGPGPASAAVAAAGAGGAPAAGRATSTLRVIGG